PSPALRLLLPPLQVHLQKCGTSKAAEWGTLNSRTWSCQHQRIAAHRSGRRRAVVARGDDGEAPAGGDSARKRVKAQGQVWQEAAVDLFRQGVSAGGSIEVVKELATNPRLYSLNLGCNRLGAAGCHRIASAIAASETLTWLNLAPGADSLAQVLNGLQQLHTLNLCDNEIGASGAGALADAMCSNSTLTRLTLSCNEIRSDGAAEIANALSHNATLKYLFLAGIPSATSARATWLQQLRVALRVFRALESAAL
ncbi:MAG: hypothetical protein ACPIOQ_02260, partial [Promethearchaeia archaeon]